MPESEEGITLDEAIEILNLLFAHIYEGSDLDLDKALLIGIEAMKRVNNPLQYNLTNPRVLLPGETKD